MGKVLIIFSVFDFGPESDFMLYILDYLSLSLPSTLDESSSYSFTTNFEGFASSLFLNVKEP
jgi:hypothetical protein